MVRDLKFLIKRVEGLFYQCSKNEGAAQLHGYWAADLPLFLHIYAKATGDIYTHNVPVFFLTGGCILALVFSPVWETVCAFLAASFAVLCNELTTSSDTLAPSATFTGSVPTIYRTIFTLLIRKPSLYNLNPIKPQFYIG